MTTSTTRHQPPTPGELTSRELQDLALGTGRWTQDQLDALAGGNHGNLFVCKVRQLLADELHRLSSNGELTLCTRTHRNSPEGCPSHGLTWSTGR